MAFRAEEGLNGNGPHEGGGGAGGSASVAAADPVSPSTERYVLKTGEAGAERLRILAAAKRPSTETLLDRIGLTPGMRVLDVGCGIGEVTRELALRVLPEGRAVGVDADAGYVETARGDSARFGLPVDFRTADACCLAGESGYDVVYSRFLLHHLPDPVRAMAAMAAALRPGGLLVVEDIDAAGHLCHPACAEFDRYVQLYISLLRHNGGDACIGPRLPAMMADTGLEGIEAEVVTPTFLDGPGRRLSRMTLDHLRQRLSSAGLSDDAEIDALIAGLGRFTSDPRHFLSMSRVFQVCARRPEAA
jgi:2-polyprenyl-3-methyl-5-hydroxy-6-metoxy-1,4-benzoquinol methylase